MRAVAALLIIVDSDKNPQLNEFVIHIRSTPDLQVIIFGHFLLICVMNFTRQLLNLGIVRFNPKRRKWTPRKYRKLLQ